MMVGTMFFREKKEREMRGDLQFKGRKTFPDMEWVLGIF